MTKDERIREAQRQLDLALQASDIGLPPAKRVLQQAIRDLEFWQRNENNKGKLEDFRKGVLVESGWDFGWSDTGECGAFAARWWRAGGVTLPDSSRMGVGDKKGAWYPIDRRTATPDDMLTVCKKWGCFLSADEWRKVKPGDLVVTSDVRTGHAAIVEDVDLQNGTLFTIEANYSGRIQRVVRGLEKVRGFGSL